MEEERLLEEEERMLEEEEREEEMEEERLLEEEEREEEMEEEELEPPDMGYVHSCQPIAFIPAATHTLSPSVSRT